MADSVESLLGFGDGTTTDELKARIVTALQNAGAWQRAGYKGGTLDRINGMIRDLSSFVSTLDRRQPFLNAQGVRDYNALSKRWAELYREVALSPDLIPKVPLSLDDLPGAIAAAGAAAKTAGEMVLVGLALYALAQAFKVLR